MIAKRRAYYVLSKAATAAIRRARALRRRGRASEDLELALSVVEYFGYGPIEPFLECDGELRAAAARRIASAVAGTK